MVIAALRFVLAASLAALSPASAAPSTVPQALAELAPTGKLRRNQLRQPDSRDARRDHR